MSVSVNTQFTGAPLVTASVTSDHYVDMQFFDDENSSYLDYYGYSFLPGYTYPSDWLFYPANFLTNHQPISIRLGSTDVSIQVRIPKYFEVLSVTDANLGCGANYAGYGVQVKYRVLDESNNPIQIAGMTPQELVTITDDAGGLISHDTQYRPFATPQATNATGQFTDIPVGSCFGAPPPTQNLCVNSTQLFNIVVTTGTTTHTYDITTVTFARDCLQGVKVITTNPDREFTRGTVN